MQVLAAHTPTPFNPPMPNALPVDIFIPHSAADADWVEEWLTPQLTDAGITTATHEDFRIGRTVALNYELAVEQSRYVAFVLTPEGLDDRWAAFAASLALHRDPANLTERLLPLLLRPCPELPAALRDLTPADFSDEGASEDELHRLVSVLKGDASNRRRRNSFSPLILLSQTLQSIRRHPLVAAIAMLVAVLVALFAIYDNSGLREAYPIFRNSTTTLAFPPAGEDETLVLIANLAASGLEHPDDCSDVDDPRRMTQTLVDSMREQLSSHPLIRIERLCRFIAAEGGSDKAMAIGKEPTFNAAIVIWGDYVAQPDPELYLHFDIIQAQNTFLRGGFNEAYGPSVVSEPDMFDFKLRLGEYLGSVTAFAAGLVLYQADEHKAAESFFTTASQIINSNLAVELIVAIHFYRGTNYLYLGRANLAAPELTAIVPDPLAIDSKSDALVIAALGNLGNAYLSLGQYDRAIEFYTQGLAIAQEIGDRNGEGTWLGALGIAYDNLGQYDKAIEFYTQALAIAQEIGDRNGEGIRLGNLGIAYDSLGQYDSAIEYSTQALAIAQEIGDRKGEGNHLGNLGNAYLRLGQYDSAIEYSTQALAIAREIGDRKGEGNQLGNLGNAYLSLGQYDRAIEFYTQALAISQEIGDRNGEGRHLGNLGIAYRNLGQYDRAIKFYTQALAIAQEIGDRNGEGNHLGHLGIAYDSLGQYDRAIEFYTQGLAISQEIGDRNGEGNHLGNLGNAYRNLGQYDRAIEFYTQALAISQEIGDRKGEGNRLGNLGIAYDSLGQYDRAIEFYTQALTIAQEIGDRRGTTIHGWNLGDLYARQEKYAQAVEVMQPLVDFYREIGHPDAKKVADQVDELRRRAAAGE